MLLEAMDAGMIHILTSGVLCMNKLAHLLVLIMVSTIALGAADRGPLAQPTKPDEGSASNRPKSPMATVSFGGKTVSAVVANTDNTRRQGLLGWTAITDDEGMLLDFGLEGQHAIHMQGMKFAIDAIWIDAKGEVRLVYENLAPNSGMVFPSMFPVMYCLEVKAGFCSRYKVKSGQKVNFSGPGS